MNMTFLLMFIVPIVLIVFILFMSRAGLYKFKGARFKTRTIYGTALSIFFSAFALWQSGGDLMIIKNGLLLGLALTPFGIIYMRYWTDKHLDGDTIYYARNHFKKTFLWFLPFMICLQISFHTEFGKQLLNAKWPLLGLALSWLVVQLFSLVYVTKIEGKIGHPIMEDMK